VTDGLTLVNQAFRRYLVDATGGSGLILDIGCGPGQYREFLGDGYIGMDLTSAVYKDGIDRGADIVGDAGRMPLATDSLDAAFSVAAIYQVSNPRCAIAEAYRVLKPGGKFLLFDYNWRTLKRLARHEKSAIGVDRVLHTQWGWKREMATCGFIETRLWLGRELDGTRVGRIERLVRLLRNEMRDGGWACVSGIKPLN
jgi:SAM-dependent methyltransferase